MVWQPARATSPLAITGIGCIGAPGAGIAAQVPALRDGRCGLKPMTAAHLPLAARLPVGQVESRLPALPSRTAALALAAAREALEHAGIDVDRRGDIALVIGSSTGGMPESERCYLERSATTPWPAYRRQQTHRMTWMVGDALRLGGPRGTHSVACASAACAIVEAMELVRCGAVPAALAVGTDALTRLTMAGFSSLQLVDAAGCRPLIAERGGMSLGEGAAALLIEDPAHARARGARPLATLAGWGLRADAYHATTPDPSATQLEATIRDALADAGVAAREVGYVSAHGTGTRDNDTCESRALAAVFGQVPTASCKRTYGHTMGASAAIEAVAATLALMRQELFASGGSELGTPIDGVAVVRAPRAAHLAAVCSTTLAFGGMNAALILTGAERCA
ncbi:MAG TPA: beta-ketoacyl synthase N-terminal-like domain-containing protein [Planctomycetota bacterium]|nr:beta-ketoacyl synthase N-terminal-like domain-containing protein [Planctomycetota bacterium]